VNLIASCGDDSTLRLFDLRLHARKGACLKVLEATRNRHFTHLDWFPKHSHFVAVASSNAMIRIYDLRNSASIVQFYAPHTESVNCVSFHPSGAYLLTCSTDRSCKLIDLIEGRPLYTLRGHTKPLFSCAFDRDGSHFATAGGDSGVRLWRSNLPSTADVVGNDIDAGFKSLLSDGRLKYNPKKKSLDTHSNRSSMDKSIATSSMFGFSQNDVPFNEPAVDRIAVAHGPLATSSPHRPLHIERDTKVELTEEPQMIKQETNQMRAMMTQVLRNIQIFTESLTRIESRLTYLENKLLQPT
jgi:WD40 repeat protein